MHLCYLSCAMRTMVLAQISAAEVHVNKEVKSQASSRFSNKFIKVICFYVEEPLNKCRWENWTFILGKRQS